MKKKSLLSRLFGKEPKPVSMDWSLTPPKPETPLAVIGDIHGRLDLLRDLLAQIPDGYQVVCVGDYIDRGPSSVGVLRFLSERDDIICLKGNHEAMMLDFLSDPDEKGRRWVRNGGLQTLAEIGVNGLTEMSGGMKLFEAQNKMYDALGEGLASWIEQLPVIHASGNIVVVHAGADPAKSIDEQKQRHLIWGHREFFVNERTDGLWVAHGHTIFDQPSCEKGRISLDTGAFATGRLTAGLISVDGTVTFVQS